MDEDADIIAEYVNGEGTACPICESSEIESDGIIAMGQAFITTKVKCNKCGSTWEEVYVLHTIQNICNNRNALED